MAEEFKKAYYLDLREFLIEEYRTKTIFPEKDDIFNALRFTDYEDVKVVILGQDPYHGHGQAHGLSFSVKPGVKIPPSLRNIFKELNADLGHEVPDNGYLKKMGGAGCASFKYCPYSKRRGSQFTQGKRLGTFSG